MARTNLPINSVTAAGSVIAGTAVDPTNDHVIAAGTPTDELLVMLGATYAGAKTYTFKKGVNPPSSLASEGDLVVSCNNETKLVQLKPGRFVQADGTIQLDVETGATGTITVLKLPRG